MATPTPVITARQGAATVTIDQTEIVRLMDRISEGAASSFLAIARRFLTGFKTLAEGQWLVDTGKSKAGFVVSDIVTDTQVGAKIENTARGTGKKPWYAYFVHYSYRTQASLQAEVARWTSNNLGTVEEETRKKLAIAWAKKTGHAETTSELAAYWRSRLARRHGVGAPNEIVAGKNLWALYVRGPAKAAEPRLIDETRAALDALARRA